MLTGKQVYIAVLAAGASRRFGSPKQLLDWGGVPLVRHAVTRATDACADRTLLVLGHEWRDVMNAAGDTPFIALNERADQGMGTSIALAARSLQRVANAIVLMPADQPLVSAEHLRALIDAWTGGSDEIVASRYAGTLGTPALFASDAFAELASLQSENGARSLFPDDRFRVQSVSCEAAAFDIDEPSDLEQRSQFTQPESPST